MSGRPSLGFVGESVSSFYQHYYRLPAGLYITQLDPESDAAAKGLVEGDILLSIDDARIFTPEELTAALSQKNVGDSVRIIIFRSGRQYSADITLQVHKGSCYQQRKGSPVWRAFWYQKPARKIRAGFAFSINPCGWRWSGW